MNELAKRIKERVADARSRLTIVRNADKFLSRPDTRNAVSRECGVLLLPISSAIELRVSYELTDKASEKNVCYVIDGDMELLPDMQPHILDKGDINLSDLMPAYDAMEIKKASFSWGMASDMFRKKYTYNLSPYQTSNEVRSAGELYGDSVASMKEELQKIRLEWDRVQTIEEISKVLLRAISQNKYEELEPVLRQINDNFQQWLTAHYAALTSSSHIAKPKQVNRILPHIAYKHGAKEKVALIVIDGMTYWQYLVLKKQIVQKGLQPIDDMTMAWIPTITKLSRQAIFRGNTPSVSYQQNPTAEKRLWEDFWTAPNRKSKRMSEYEVAYQHGSLCIEDSTAMRMAAVDADLDEKMHALSNNTDLYLLTENWAKNVAEDIANIHNMGYTIYLTTDHGNLMSHAWRGLTSQEKTFLYKDGSRGQRHLIYNDAEHMNNFISANRDEGKSWRTDKDWLVWKTDKCFKSADCITHGGSHFLEVVIPFIKI